MKLKPGKVVLQDGYLVHTGTVTNTGKTARGGNADPDGPSVNVTYYDANGTILGSSLTNLVNPVPPGTLVQIAPGATASYRLLARQSYYWYSPSRVAVLAAAVLAGGSVAYRFTVDDVDLAQRVEIGLVSPVR